jgi:hypothetical protein
MSDKRVTGPIQVFVIGFDDFEASGRIMAELRRVRKRGVIRLVDLLHRPERGGAPAPGGRGRRADRPAGGRPGGR